MKLLRDLFMGPGNTAWDLGRVMSAWGMAALCGVQVHALIVGQPLDVLQFGTALAAVLGGAAIFVAAKDRAAAKVEESGKPQPVEVVNPPSQPVPVEDRP